MNVFISWSKETSKHIALAWHEFLPNVIQAVRPFMSGHDIGAGERWANRISTELENTNHAIVCLTADNLESPWIHFEAGAVAKFVDKSRLFTFLYPPNLSPSEIKYPLAAFQAKQATKDGIQAIVWSINVDMGINALTPERLSTAFDKHIDDFVSAIAKAPEPKAPPPKRELNELMEELIQLVRASQAPARSLLDDKTRDREVELLRIEMELDTSASSAPSLSSLAKRLLAISSQASYVNPTEFQAIINGAFARIDRSALEPQPDKGQYCLMQAKDQLILALGILKRAFLIQDL